MQVYFFYENYFGSSKIMFSWKNLSIESYASQEYLLDYMDLPYHFGILRISTFC